MIRATERTLWTAVAVMALGASLLTASSALSSPTAPSSDAPQRTVDVTYRFTVRDLVAGAKEVAAWVPIPPSNGWQTLEEMRVESDLPYTTVTESDYGNSFLRFDLTRAAEKGSGSISTAVTFRVTRRGGSSLDLPETTLHASQKELSRYLAPDKLIPIDGKIAKEAEEVAGDVKDPLTKARRLYDHIVNSMKYDKTGTGWGRGDARYACDVRAGNCTDFHSLFIGEARSLEIPARFVMGIPVPADKAEGAIPGYHCWAEFYLDKHGWVPVDASEANKHPEKRDALFAGLDANRVQFTVGRDIRLTGAASEPVNYSINAHVEVDGKAYPKVETTFSFKDVEETPKVSGG